MPSPCNVTRILLFDPSGKPSSVKESTELTLATNCFADVKEGIAELNWPIEYGSSNCTPGIFLR